MTDSIYPYKFRSCEARSNYCNTVAYLGNLSQDYGNFLGHLKYSWDFFAKCDKKIFESDLGDFDDSWDVFDREVVMSTARTGTLPPAAEPRSAAYFFRKSCCALRFSPQSWFKKI